MRKPFSILFAAVFFSFECSAQQKKVESLGEIISLYSTSLKDSMDCYLYLPPDYSTSTAKYPVIYLLDGNYYFSFTTQALKILAENQQVPPCILVGVSSKNRERDFTTPQRKDWNPPMAMPQNGGIDRFLGFMEKELIPYIEKNYRTETTRIIIGHSLAGLVPLYALYKKPLLFRSTIYVDGSAWWNEGEVGQSAIQYLQTHPDHTGKFVWIRDKIPHEAWFPITKQLHDYFHGTIPAGLQFSFFELPDETHATVIYPAVYTGIKEIFRGYPIPFDEKMSLQRMSVYYDSLSDNYGYKVIPPQNVYNNLQRQLVYLKKEKEALQTTILWQQHYPSSFQPNLELAKRYLSSGNKTQAAVFLKNAVGIEPGNKEMEELLKRIK